VALANAKGGTILVGVQDNGRVIGLEENFQSLDERQRVMMNKIKNKAGQIAGTLVNIDFEEIDKRMIARIDVYPSKMPIIMSIQRKDQSSQEVLLVRTGAMNTKIISLREIIDYFQFRFK
jgi:predicted HTH transcriptional regulator